MCFIYSYVNILVRKNIIFTRRQKKELYLYSFYRFSDGFFPSASRLWNSLPSSVFPVSFNLPSFKRQVYHHLMDQMAWFFLLPFLDIFIFLFYSFHCLSIPFPKGCRLEKGHIVPVLCSHSQKKKKNYVFTFTHLFIMENYNSFLYSKKKKKKKRNIRNNRLIIKRIITIIITTTITIIRIQPKTASVAFTKGANNPNIH